MKLDAGKPILAAAGQLVGYVSFFENFIQIAVLLIAWFVVLVAFFILALFGGLMIVLWFGATQLQAGRISPGELTRFGLYTIFVGGAMGQAAELFNQVQKSVGATQRVRELLRETTEIVPDEQTAAPAGLPTGIDLRPVVRLVARGDAPAGSAAVQVRVLDLVDGATDLDPHVRLKAGFYIRQIANAISTGGPFSVTFPSELTASVSVFRLSGAAMATAGGSPP